MDITPHNHDSDTGPLTPENPQDVSMDDASVDPKVAQVRQMPLAATRYDLKVSPQLYLGKTVYVVKDPVSLKYFRLRPAEYMIFTHLDGKANSIEIAELVSNAYPDEETDPDDVLKFVGMMRGNGLLLGRGAGHAKYLRSIRDTQKSKMRRAKLTNYLFIRIPVLDPDQMLNWLYRIFSPVMNRTTMWLALIFIGVSAVAACSSLSKVGKLEFPVLGATNLLLITIVFFVVKVVHEFGHGLAAKHRGIEMHEMGVMLMVFMPLFYVDVSDAWMVPNRKERLWITAGGVFIEFIFASVAVWVWLSTGPGLVNQMAFDTLLSASVTTLLFNANPLLRYDGYYFLMDYLEIPNLKAKSSQFMGWLARTYLLKSPGNEPADEVRARPIFMVLYSVASGVYRWVIVFGIVVLVWHILDPYGLESIGTLLGIAALVTMILMPMFKTLRFTWSVQTQNWRRVGVTLVMGAGLFFVSWFVLSIETEDSVEHPAVILARHRLPVYSVVEGDVVEVYVKEGDWVKAGDPIIRLANETIGDRLRELELEQEITVMSISHARQFGRLNDVATLSVQKKQLGDRVEFLGSRVKQLVVRAPSSGRVQPVLRLSTMLGLHVTPGMKIGEVLGVDELEAVVVLPQADAEMVKVGMVVRTCLWASANQTHEGEVVRMTRQFIGDLPHAALAGFFGGEVDTVAQGDYKTSPYTPSVLAYVKLKSTRESILIDGMTGRVKLVLRQSSLGSQQWRTLKQSFSLDWLL